MESIQIKLARREAFTAAEREKFPPLPEKMQEYIENGLGLGWLLNRYYPPSPQFLVANLLYKT